MKFVESENVINIFNLLNSSGIHYVLLRNLDEELPGGLQVGKDIDILVSKKDDEKILNFFQSNQYKKLLHPLRNDVFLYGANKFKFQYNKKNNILFDLNYQVLVRSLDEGQWLPLDQDIQNSAWKNKRFLRLSTGLQYWTLSYEDELICLISRSVFDKKVFHRNYINRIEELLILIDEKIFLQNLSKVFFKYTPYLMKLVKMRAYDDILTSYFLFKRY